MEAPKVKTFVMIDPDTEECITQIEKTLIDDYHIYTNVREIVAHAVIEMYLNLPKTPSSLLY